MQWWSIGFLGAVCTVGCTNLALERHTIKQVETGGDLRYKDVLNNLAVFAANPYSLPSLNAIFNGSTKVSDLMQPMSSTAIGRQAVGAGTATFPQTETLTIPGERQVYGMWTLDPVSSPEKLRAVRACCWRVLYGPEFGPSDDQALLRKYNPKKDPPGHYFDVKSDLEDIDKNHSGWLHQGCLADVPIHARCKAHCHGKWVWVMPDGMEGLSKFSLIMAKLARVPTDAWYFPPPETRTLVFADQTQRPQGMSISVTAYLDSQGRLVSGAQQYAEPFKHRMEVTPQDPTLRAQVTAAAAGSSSH